MSEYIPACPPANSRGMRGIMMANESTNIRERAKVFIPEPPPLEDEQVVVPRVQRRKFVQPPTIVNDDTFHSRR